MKKYVPTYNIIFLTGNQKLTKITIIIKTITYCHIAGGLYFQLLLSFILC